MYNDFRIEMEEHTLKKEVEVFPLMKQYAENPNAANGELEDEHDVAEDFLKEMRVITDGFIPLAHACGSYRITYNRLVLEKATFEHVHLENNVLFPRL